MLLLARSGLQILMDHPRLYWNVHCTPGTEWVRFTPVQVPLDRMYTAKDDARYLSPWIGLPGGRHTLGLARHWHFVSALFWTLNGVVYIALLFVTDQQASAGDGADEARLDDSADGGGMGIKVSTVRQHMVKLYRKAGVHGRRAWMEKVGVESREC